MSVSVAHRNCAVIIFIGHFAMFPEIFCVSVNRFFAVAMLFVADWCWIIATSFCVCVRVCEHEPMLYSRDSYLV